MYLPALPLLQNESKSGQPKPNSFNLNLIIALDLTEEKRNQPPMIFRSLSLNCTRRLTIFTEPERAI